MQETKEMWVWLPGWEDLLEKGLATCSSVLGWKIPWAEEPGGLQSMGLQRDCAHTHTYTHTHETLGTIIYMVLDQTQGDGELKTLLIALGFTWLVVWFCDCRVDIFVNLPRECSSQAPTLADLKVGYRNQKWWWVVVMLCTKFSLMVSWGAAGKVCGKPLEKEGSAHLW